MPPKKLGVDTIRHDPFLCFPLDIILAAKLRESPFPANDNLLTAGELEFGTTESLLCMGAVVIPATNRKKDLADVNTSTSPQWLPKSTPHASLEPVGPST